MTDLTEWHDWRRGGIGASDIGALLGLSKWQSPWSLWASKCGLIPPSETTERQQMGHDFEPIIAQLFTRKTGLYVAGEQTWCSKPDEPWMRCTADGFVMDAAQLDEEDRFFHAIDALPFDMDLALGGFEAKTDGRFGWPDGVPPSYEAQCQWSMGVTGLPQWWIAVLFSGWRFEVFEVKRDVADIEFMMQRARTFWTEHCLPGNPPPTDGSDATLEALAAVYPDPTEGSSVELGDEARQAHTQWLAAKAGISEWTRLAKEAQAVLEATLGDAEEGAIDGVPVVSWRQQTRAAHQVAESTFRVLRPMKPKKERTNARP